MPPMLGKTEIAVGVAYADLMNRILAAHTEPQLLALVDDLLSVTRGTPTLDYGEAWMMRWHAVTNGKPLPDAFLSR